MPRIRPTHDLRRKKICAICRKKGKDMNPLTSGKPWTKFKTFFPNWDPDDQTKPGGICGGCRKKLAQNSNPPKLFDFSTLEFPASGEALRDLVICSCVYCALSPHGYCQRTSTSRALRDLHRCKLAGRSPLSGIGCGPIEDPPPA